jgi:hypothetical protein
MTILFFSSCKEELLQPKEEEKNPKVTDSKVITETLLDVQLGDENPDKKAKFEKLKKEHSLPYAILQRPDDILKDFLLKKNSKSVINSLKKTSAKTVLTGGCDTVRVDVWALEKYTPFSGIVGIQPQNDWAANLWTLGHLKNKYGFSNILMQEMNARNCINNNGAYSVGEILLVFDPPNLVIECIDQWNLGTLAGCYYDEPSLNYGIEESRNYLINTVTHWRAKFSSPIVLGERTHVLAHEYDDLVDIVNGTQYSEYHYYPPYCVKCYYPLEADQRDSWDSFNSSFSNKFECLWISALEDQSEFSDLIGHARNMGKSTIWLWWGDDWNTIASFCYWANQNSYLSRQERKYIYEYVYIGSGDSCTDTEITSWMLNNIIPTNDLR